MPRTTRRHARDRGRRLVRASAAGGAVLAMSVSLAACGDAEDAPDPSATHTARNGEVYNDADVDFATSMIPHHAQAVEMALMAQQRDPSPEVAALAGTLRDAQVAEVELMVDWLTAWGQEIPETSMDHANAGHDMSGGESSGDDMEALEAASGTQFEQLWLEMMIEHHTGTIEMARAEQDAGLHPAAMELAASVQAAQEREIAQMQQLLD